MAVRQDNRHLFVRRSAPLAFDTAAQIIWPANTVPRRGAPAGRSRPTLEQLARRWAGRSCRPTVNRHLGRSCSLQLAAAPNDFFIAARFPMSFSLYLIGFLLLIAGIAWALT